MKTKKNVLGLAGILGVLGLGIHALNTSFENVKAESIGGEWALPTSITIGKGEEIYPIAKGGDQWTSIEEVEPGKDYKKKLAFSDYGILYGKSLGKCKIFACNSVTDDLFVDSKGKIRRYTKVTVKKAPKKVSFKKKSITIKVGHIVKLPGVKVNKGSACRSFYYHAKGSENILLQGKRVKGLKKGIGKVKVQTYNGKEATLKVIVK